MYIIPEFIILPKKLFFRPNLLSGTRSNCSTSRNILIPIAPKKNFVSINRVQTTNIVFSNFLYLPKNLSVLHTYSSMLKFLIESHTSSSVAKLKDSMPFTLWLVILVSDHAVVYNASPYVRLLVM